MEARSPSTGACEVVITEHDGLAVIQAAPATNLAMDNALYAEAHAVCRTHGVQLFDRTEPGMTCHGNLAKAVAARFAGIGTFVGDCTKGEEIGLGAKIKKMNNNVKVSIVSDDRPGAEKRLQVVVAGFGKDLNNKQADTQGITFDTKCGAKRCRTILWTYINLYWRTLDYWNIQLIVREDVLCLTLQNSASLGSFASRLICF